jgi:hypothetical protein
MATAIERLRDDKDPAHKLGQTELKSFREMVIEWSH